MSVYSSDANKLSPKVSSKKKKINLESWMENLPDECRQRHMSKLVIPGSHHSMSFGIVDESALSGDYTKMELTGIWRLFGPIFSKKVLTRWSRVQNEDLTSQLYKGVRYFDLRVEYDRFSKMISCVHLMQMQSLDEGLSMINNFLQLHPKELVILDFQHFINFTPSGHATLQNLLRAKFENKLCPGDFSITKISLEAMYRNGHQVIVVYRKFESPYQFFKGCFFPIVYSKSEHAKELTRSMIQRLSTPWPDKWFLIVHMVLKPGQNKFAYKRFSRNAQSYAKEALKPTGEFVDYLKTSSNRPTIIVANFVDLNNSTFPRLVVALNYSDSPTALRLTQSTHSSPGMGLIIRRREDSDSDEEPKKKYGHRRKNEENLVVSSL